VTATVAAPMRLSIDAWDPAYGASGEADLGESSAQVDPEVEVPAGHWAAIEPDPTVRLPAAVLFVDGIRRIDARAWVEEQSAEGRGRSATQGLCASYAAGVLCCCAGRAHLVSAEVHRGLFTTAPHAVDLPTRAGLYIATIASTRSQALEGPALNLALQRNLVEVEIQAATLAREAQPEQESGDDLLVVDGPLRGRQHLPRTLGFVKSHLRTYLPDPLNRLVSTLGPRQRTPVFRMGTSWERHSWYLRLPSTGSAPWAGVVRVECRTELDLGEVVSLANLSQVTLSRYASVEYKDPRAPQNLYPIAGLERELRRRLGNTQLIYRALRLAAQRAT
jgi:hypothetical protein